MIYFISDTHFNHRNIIKYTDRPFNDITEMNNTLINNWNSIIKEDDIVYHLGDFALTCDEKLKELYSYLNGTIILIRGNHDGKSVKYYEDIGFKVLKDGYINLHGHIHNKKLNQNYPSKNYSKDNHKNVSADVTNFKPISLYEINKLRK